MALVWNTTACTPAEPVDDLDSQTRDAVIYGLNAIAVGNLTEATIHEVVTRTIAARSLSGSPLCGVEDLVGTLRRWIGLKTNITTIGRKEWLAREIEDLIGRAEWRAQLLIEEDSAAEV